MTVSACVGRGLEMQVPETLLSGAPPGGANEGETEGLAWKCVYPDGAKGWGKRRRGGQGERKTDTV